MEVCATTSEEYVQLVDARNRPCGMRPKAYVHGFHTPLHRAFSVFLFDRHGRLLLQRRALGKFTWPGVWSNSCCGHPSPGEHTQAAAHRRVGEELGLTGGDLFEALPNFRYRARFGGIQENEICPVFVGRANGVGEIDVREVAAVAWMPWHEFLHHSRGAIPSAFGSFSPWSRQEARQLERVGVLKSGQFETLTPFEKANSHEQHIPA